MGKLHDILVFLREYHELKREKRSFCKSCETYKEQLALANFEKKQLLERLLFVPVKEEPTTIAQPTPILPRIVPWKMQRQMLEAEDRATAAAMRKKEEEIQQAERVAAASVTRAASGGVQAPAAQHISEISVSELEKELGVE